jgi:acetyl/propionyl-CoA carboxylase alpha subunit
MFKKVLVANRGEIAVRVMRTCRKLGIASVAVYSDADRDAVHVKYADEAVHVGGPAARDSYLRIDALVDAIGRTGADAVHPGYGLLSENGGFSAAVAQTGARFIGPSRAVLEAFGDKLQARELARTVGMASPPGTVMPVHTLGEEALTGEAARLGYPVLVKAAGGGGGIGMQPVFQQADLAAAVASCSARGKASFADERVYLEKYMRRPRHLEVQVLAAGLSNARAVGGRECSVQRRHQKVIEEAPGSAAFLNPEMRERMYSEAERLIGVLDYRGAATVEFIADAEADAPFPYFLEVNARLQVEHPVTEMTTGLDLVEWQLRIAAGENALPERTPPRGHAIEARLCAEDPARAFVPQPGVLSQLVFPRPSENFRVDSGYESGSSVSSHYDSLLAKLIAWGETRESARCELLRALGETRIQLDGPKGPRVTNLDFLMRLLQSPPFISGDYDTSLVEQLKAKT